jgi:hypothetical protein
LPKDITLRDLGEHHLKGLLRSEKIYQLIVPGLQKEFPAPASISTATNSLPSFREIGDQHRVNMCQSELAHIERYQGHYGQALSMYRETIPVWQKLGHRAAIAHQLECLAMIARVTEQVQRAARLFGGRKLCANKSIS